MTESVGRLSEAVERWLDGLTADGQAVATLPFEDVDDGERRHWFYWPGERRGLPLADMDGAGQRSAYDVLAAMVSPTAFAQAVTIVGFEDVLRRLEADGQRGRRRIDGLARDPLAYHVSLFGSPGKSEPWGVRFEGHHVSVHATVVDDQLTVAPAFLGANPSRVGSSSLDPLGHEQDLGFGVRELVAESASGLVARMVIDDEAPDDVLTKASPSVEPFDDTAGVALADLGSSPAAALFEQALREHIDRVPAPEAERWWRTIEPTLPSVRFAWAGRLEKQRPGLPHYFRFWHPRLLIEHDNTQNDADHAHNVVRDPGGDFGSDALRRHHATHPHSH